MANQTGDNVSQQHCEETDISLEKDAVQGHAHHEDLGGDLIAGQHIELTEEDVSHALFLKCTSWYFSRDPILCLKSSCNANRVFSFLSLSAG